MQCGDIIEYISSIFLEINILRWKFIYGIEMSKEYPFPQNLDCRVIFFFVENEVQIFKNRLAASAVSHAA